MSDKIKHTHPGLPPEMKYRSIGDQEEDRRKERAMTDPNKAAVTESNAEFIARMKRPENDQAAWVAVDKPDLHHLIALAEERVMIEEHDLYLQPPWYSTDGWSVEPQDGPVGYDQELSTALRAVVAKIGGKHE